MIKLLPHQIACALYIRITLTKFKHNPMWAPEESVDQQTRMLLFALKLIRDSDITWKELQVQLRSVLDDIDMASLVKEFHKLQYTQELMEAVKSFETLLDISNKPHPATDIHKACLARSSVLGVFIRKLVLEFKKMSFDMANNLRQSVCDYLNSTPHKETETQILESTHVGVNTSIDISTSDISCMEESLMEGEKENISIKPDTSIENSYCSSVSDEEILLSRNQVIRFITEQVRFVENHDNAAMPPSELQEKIIEIRKLYPDIKEVYYLSFMNYLRVTEGNRAANSLQLYFDCKEFGADFNEAESSELEKHQRKFKAFRYCALNMGIMHCHYGNYSQAMISLEECIQIAQQTNDQKCLNHAMFWLSVVKDERNELVEGNSHLKAFVADTVKKIMDTENNFNLKEIDYLGLLRYTKVQAFKGLITPLKALDVIARIVSELKVSNCAQLTRSSLLDFYGFKHCAMTSCQFPLQNMNTSTCLKKINSNSNVIEDKLLVTSLCQLATLIASENSFEEAEYILSFARDQFPIYSPLQKKLTLCELQVKFDYYIGTRNLKEAFRIAKSMITIDTLEGKYSTAVVNLVSGNLSSALKSTTLLLHSVNENSISVAKMPLLNVKLLLLMIEMKFLQLSTNGLLDYIFKLTDFVKSCNMYGKCIDTNMALIRAQLQLGLIHKAKNIVDQTLHQALAFGTYYQKGLLFYLKAKCMLADTDNNDSNVLKESLTLLDKSLEYFSSDQFIARKKDIFFEKAMIYHKMGRLQERNKMSTQFRNLDEKLEGYMPVLIF